MSTIDVPPTGPATTAGTVALTDRETLADYGRRWIDGVRSGELGSLPIVVGIIAIALYFSSRSDVFLTSGNFVNLIVQMSPIAIIGMGIVFVLLLGEIDLSVGYVSAVGGVTTTLLLVPDGNQVGLVPALILGIGAGTAIGALHGFLFAKVGIPSFVVTLAGLLAWNGVVLQLIGDRGTVTVESGFVNGLANDFLPDATAWLLLALGVAAYAGVQALGVRARRRAGLPTVPPALIGLRIGALAIAGIVVVDVANQNRGVPYVALVMAFFVVLLTFVATRTRFGRYVYAVGGSAEAANRAGISVARIRIAVFAICSTMAAVGGIVLASRLNSVDTSAGGGSTLLYSIAAAVIGGTSLFGGRGKVSSAILGAIVIAMIDNGLGLTNVSAGTKFIVTGLVLLAAVTVDSVSRRKARATGRA